MAMASNPDAPAFQVQMRVLGFDIYLSGRLNYKAPVMILSTGICDLKTGRIQPGFISRSITTT